MTNFKGRLVNSGEGTREVGGGQREGGQQKKSGEKFIYKHKLHGIDVFDQYIKRKSIEGGSLLLLFCIEVGMFTSYSK